MGDDVTAGSSCFQEVLHQFFLSDGICLLFRIKEPLIVGRTARRLS